MLIGVSESFQKFKPETIITIINYLAMNARNYTQSKYNQLKWKNYYR